MALEDRTPNYWRAKYEALKADNEILRQTLDDIVHRIYSNEARLQWIERIAKAALKHTNDGETEQ